MVFPSYVVPVQYQDSYVWACACGHVMYFACLSLLTRVIIISSAFGLNPFSLLVSLDIVAVVFFGHSARWCRVPTVAAPVVVVGAPAVVRVIMRA